MGRNGTKTNRAERYFIWTFTFGTSHDTDRLEFVIHVLITTKTELSTVAMLL